MVGLSRHAIFNQVTASLARLDTEYVDLLQIHRFDYNTPIEETMAALHDLVKMGKVRYIGASSMWTYQFAQMQFCAERNGWTRFVSMQNQYSLLYREEEREMNRFCGETGVGLIPVRISLLFPSSPRAIILRFSGLIKIIAVGGSFAGEPRTTPLKARINNALRSRCCKGTSGSRLQDHRSRGRGC
jgi:hypothetical protein